MRRLALRDEPDRRPPTVGRRDGAEQAPVGRRRRRRRAPSDGRPCGGRPDRPGRAGREPREHRRHAPGRPAAQHPRLRRLRPAHRHLLRPVDARLGAARRRRPADHGLGAERPGRPGRRLGLRHPAAGAGRRRRLGRARHRGPRAARRPARPARARRGCPRRWSPERSGACSASTAGCCRPGTPTARSAANLLVEGLFRGALDRAAGRGRLRRRRCGHRRADQRRPRRAARAVHAAAHAPARATPPSRWSSPSRRSPATRESRGSGVRSPRDVGTALAALALLALLQNLDVVVLGREEPGNAGAYAAISVACKALVLASFVLAGFLLPEAAARRQLGQHALHQLGGDAVDPRGAGGGPAGARVRRAADRAVDRVRRAAHRGRARIRPARRGDDLPRRDRAAQPLPARRRSHHRGARCSPSGPSAPAILLVARGRRPGSDRPGGPARSGRVVMVLAGVLVLHAALRRAHAGPTTAPTARSGSLLGRRTRRAGRTVATPARSLR